MAVEQNDTYLKSRKFYIETLTKRPYVHSQRLCYPHLLKIYRTYIPEHFTSIPKFYRTYISERFTLILKLYRTYIFERFTAILKLYRTYLLERFTSIFKIYRIYIPVCFISIPALITFIFLCSK